MAEQIAYQAAGAGAGRLAGRPRSLLARVTRSNGFAWGLSLAFHALVFGVLWASVFRNQDGPRREIIPEARLAALPGPVINQPLPFPRPARESPAEPRPPEIPADPGVVAAGSTAADVLALPPGLTASHGTLGEAAPLPTGPAAAPMSRFFGQTGNAYRVAYVVDVSASLMVYTGEIAREMHASIQALVPTQQFQVVLAMPGGEVQEFASGRMVPAIGQYKRQAAAFIERIRSRPAPGAADPIRGLQQALAVRPELIYFLTDGDYRNIEAELERRLEEMNPRREVRINTIGFDPSPGPRSLLERIARQHGGRCRIVAAR